MRNFDGPVALSRQWPKNKANVLFLSVWKCLNNPGFDPLEFKEPRKVAGRNRFSQLARVRSGMPIINSVLLEKKFAWPASSRSIATKAPMSVSVSEPVSARERVNNRNLGSRCERHKNKLN
jgi:hypothetical protein